MALNGTLAGSFGPGDRLDGCPKSPAGPEPAALGVCVPL